MTATMRDAGRPLTALDVIYGRRSVRSYVQTPLPASTVRALIDAAVQAPTAMLRQPWSFVVVQDAWVLAHISKHAKQLLLEQEQVATTRGAQPEHERRLHDAFFARLDDPAFNIFYNAPALIVICTHQQDPFAVGDCWLAAENLMLAASALGLGSCCIGAAVGALNSSEVRTLLRIPADVHAVAPIVVGVPLGGAAPVSRREAEIISWR